MSGNYDMELLECSISKFLTGAEQYRSTPIGCCVFAAGAGTAWLSLCCINSSWGMVEFRNLCWISGRLKWSQIFGCPLNIFDNHFHVRNIGWFLPVFFSRCIHKTEMLVPTDQKICISNLETIQDAEPNDT